MDLKNNKDHWAFLEEIEAPMWVDLTLEAKSTNQVIDDGWFHSTHRFHHCSSHELKAAFSHSGDSNISSNFDLEGPFSPRLPPSVSRSRGKHYKNNTGRGEECTLLGKQNPVKVLNGKSSSTSIESFEETKCNLRFTNKKGTSRSNPSLVSERAFNGNFKGKNLISCSSSVLDDAGESNKSTVTSESDPQSQQGNLEISSQAIRHTSGLLSAMRISLRKSCVTRQASRVKVNDDERQSRDHKSSSGKSSVGSSANPCHDVKGSMVQNKEQTPDSRNVARMTIAAKNKVKYFNASKSLNAQVIKGIDNSRRVGIRNNEKSAQQKPAKSKAQNQALCRLDEKGSLTSAAKAKEKVRVGGCNRSVIAGKENMKAIRSPSTKCSSRNIAIGGRSKQNEQREFDRTGLVGAKRKIRGPSKRKQAMNMTQRVYFR